MVHAVLIFFRLTGPFWRWRSRQRVEGQLACHNWFDSDTVGLREERALEPELYVLQCVAPDVYRPEYLKCLERIKEIEDRCERGLR